jgi:drug/metabolite transporter (DMT)-like permease
MPGGLGRALSRGALEAALVVTWSAGFIGIRFSADYAPMVLILLWRSLVAGVVLLPLALAWGPRITFRDVAEQALLGGLAMALYLGAFSLAIANGVPTGLVALITDMLPLIVALLSWPVLGHRLSRTQWLGSLLGFAGVIIASGWTLPGGSAPLWAYGLPVLGTTALALSTLLQSRHTRGRLSVSQSLCLQCLAAAAVFALVSWPHGGVLPVLTPGFAGGILWLAFVATFGAWGLYYLALRTSSPARVTAVLYLSPPVTMIWAFLVFSEPLSWAMALGFAVSLAGIIIVAHSTQGKQTREAL